MSTVTTSSVKDEILALLQRRPKTGWTDNEIELALGRTHQSVSATRRRLVTGGAVENSGKRRTNQFGNECTVWVPVQKGE